MYNVHECTNVYLLVFSVSFFDFFSDSLVDFIMAVSIFSSSLLSLYIIHCTLYIAHSIMSVINTVNTKMIKLETTMPCVLALPSSRAPPSMR